MSKFSVFYGKRLNEIEDDIDDFNKSIMSIQKQFIVR